MQTYKGFDVSGGATKDNESQGFFPTLCITKHRDIDNVTNEKIFNLPRVEENIFSTEHDAIQAALRFGFSIIDGQIHDLTVDDL